MRGPLKSKNWSKFPEQGSGEHPSPAKLTESTIGAFKGLNPRDHLIAKSHLLKINTLAVINFVFRIKFLYFTGIQTIRRQENNFDDDYWMIKSFIYVIWVTGSLYWINAKLRGVLLKCIATSQALLLATIIRKSLVVQVVSAYYRRHFR